MNIIALFFVAALVSGISTAITCKIVHAHRIRTRGVGGAWDIAIVGTIVTMFWLLGALIYIAQLAAFVYRNETNNIIR